MPTMVPTETAKLPDVLVPWSKCSVTRLWDEPSHAIHAYFNTCPESPDGKHILVYVSETKEGHEGRLVVIERETGKQRVVAQGITCEDSHRQACQQWAAGGKKIAFHNLVDGAWGVYVVGLDGGEPVKMADGRQIGFGPGAQDMVTLHGTHWAPGPYRDLQILDVNTGEIKTVLTCDRVREHFGAWAKETFGEAQTSIFFPVLSPDASRVFFKLAQPKDATFQSKTASKRDGLIVFDIKQDKLLSRRDKWGHPTWHKDNRTIMTPMNVVFDSDTGTERVLTEFCEWPGSHPNYHPDGRLFTTDSYLRGEEFPPGWWSVVVCDPETGTFVRLHELRQLPDGSTSWRPAHPHPVFSHDGKRLYFNVSKDGWTRLHVAQV
jgi:hypothetical protein